MKLLEIALKHIKKVLRAHAIKIMLDDWWRCFLSLHLHLSLFVCNFLAIIFPTFRQFTVVLSFFFFFGMKPEFFLMYYSRDVVYFVFFFFFSLKCEGNTIFPLRLEANPMAGEADRTNIQMCSFMFRERRKKNRFGTKLKCSTHFNRKFRRGNTERSIKRERKSLL